MSTVIQLALGVGGPGLPSLADAGDIAAAAGEAGVAAIRLADQSPAGRALDPTVVAAYLAGLHDGIGFLPVVPTTGNAPYNAARRLLSLDRATGGRAGVVLRPGGGDEVSEASVPDPGATDPARRWTEYARVLTQLWESFPNTALLGDQQAGVVADDTLIRPIAHEGAFYRVAGPLDGPSSVQGRPVLVADLGTLDVTAVAASADVVVVDRTQAAGVDAVLSQALRLAGRDRGEVALLGRVSVTRGDAVSGGLPARLRAWADEQLLDGFELVPEGGPDHVIAILRALEPRPQASTLRAAYGLREGALV
ncbi:alkanesulfonate monooxygenase SsuD/methylene tetrahydromethanopterin reductase-like flavin-dependent oxidoreductase (luciferase family) [Actinoplanes lutulentus]|uniref:Luciferase-like monooxygenase n=1 Tax=Actinoplanes lutulentus TaxID=1287878 RepID=A0A327ZP77_9ACTN|nr:LLM class flavin-dependent oxidoreductase [Actinoplanes lutulentus]MBB2940925.1 alkanesulfonate monooxygenase SsuD/methylene tetrahydromethanopterin reductase-like flavin-dependent oxidoreductase (luciferase family) [Actinoplanes lutulentus]RAK43234.1 luciferase-like monooxygenase [Actinoplanes lutulentus]